MQHTILEYTKPKIKVKWAIYVYICGILQKIGATHKYIFNKLHVRSSIYDYICNKSDVKTWIYVYVFDILQVEHAKYE